MGEDNTDQNISFFLSAPAKHGLRDDPLTAGEHMRNRETRGYHVAGEVLV